VSLLQRRLRVGYSRAARLIDLMEERGVIGPDQGGSLGREVFIDDKASPPAASHTTLASSPPWED